jgi:hypothetical protein
MVDAGNANAAASLRQTLADLDDQLGLTPPEAEGWFSLFDVSLSITKEEIGPGSAIGQALLRSGRTELISYYCPPDYPPGWRGTALDGDPAEFAERTGGDYAGTFHGLGFWQAWPGAVSATEFAAAARRGERPTPSPGAGRLLRRR